MFQRLHRDQVFVAGGQPSVTYVDREQFHLERNLARAIAAPNQIVSLAGPTKTGKTVLCRQILENRDYVWIDGGEIDSTASLWNSVRSELNIPDEVTHSDERSSGVDGGLSTPVISAKGSKLRKRAISEKRLINSVADALHALVSDNIILVVDDFHYLSSETRTTFLRNIKGAVFAGLKVILLSVTHRAFDAIKAESELTGRFTSITLPNWTTDELKKIASLGFAALYVNCRDALIEKLAHEAQDSPFLMQKFCWEICYDCNIEYVATILTQKSIPDDYDAEAMFVRLAQDAGLPIYQKLVAGPQSRKSRTKRPLRAGGEADIYQALLLALAETGPKSSISYDELRSSLNAVLSDMVPQKHEVTAALKHLGQISMKAGTEIAVDWDDDNREVNLTDPYLRFFLRWQVRSRPPSAPLLWSSQQ